ncbi:MAG: hypothetical protein K5796_11200 [Lachnospiraceae bacterium]|nr:hypothetical protein [Lachnospiraceae bacterium]
MTPQVLACVGKQAEKPYYFEKIYTNIYSVEELCYALYENAFLIDNDIVSKDLADWIYKECGLTDLAAGLYPLVNQNAQAVSFVGTILEYTGYYGRDEIEKAESILRMNISMSVFEKWKAKADFLLENRHYILACKEYERVLAALSEDETELKSKIYNNMGVAYMALYLTDKAAECFKTAYAIDNNETAYKHYLAAMRLKLSDDEYIKLIASEDEAYKMSIRLESEFEEIKKGFENTERAKSMQALMELKDSGNASLYYEEIGRMAERLKADYRDVVLEGD